MQVTRLTPPSADNITKRSLSQTEASTEDPHPKVRKLTQSIGSLEEFKENDPPLAEKIKIKKTIPEKLTNNLKLAKEQQESEKEKSFTVHTGEVPATIEVKIKVKIQKRYEEQTFIQPFVDQSKTINGRSIAIVTCTGRRPSMEDTHIALEAIHQTSKKEYPYELYGIFDGHGGMLSTNFVHAHFASLFSTLMTKYNPDALTREGIYKALWDTFIQLDEACTPHKDGTTASVLLVIDGWLWMANVGDSRIIASHKKAPLQLTQDGKLSNPRYVKKVTKLGGEVILKDTYRINGFLSCAGSLGDRYILGKSKKCCLPPQPQITDHSLDQIDFALLACDGYFDRCTTNGTIEAIHSHLVQGDSYDAISKRLVYSAIESNGSLDNVSMIIVPFIQK